MHHLNISDIENVRESDMESVVTDAASSANTLLNSNNMECTDTVMISTSNRFGAFESVDDIQSESVDDLQSESVDDLQSESVAQCAQVWKKL